MKAMVSLLPRSSKVKETAVERQHFFDVPDFQCYVVEGNGARPCV
jgi:hypothetical protein